MNGAERQKRRGITTSDFLIFIAVAGLGFTISMGSDLTRLGSRTGWHWFQDFWERSSADDASYSVRPGDTLAGIAEKHGVALGALVSINRIVDPDRLEVRQTLLIPGSDRAIPETPPAPLSPPLQAEHKILAETGTEPQDQPADSKGVVEIAAAALDRLLEGLGIEGWGDGFVGGGDPPEVSAGNPMGTTVAAAPMPTSFQTVDGLLAMAEDELLSESFQNALETSQTALRLLELEDDPVRANPRRARLEIFSATAHTTFGHSRAARLNFERALEWDPDLVLDSARNSPQVLLAFGEACLTALPDRELACRSFDLPVHRVPPSWSGDGTARPQLQSNVEVEVDWFAELAEQLVWSGMRLAEQLSQVAVSVARGLGSPWNWSTQPAAELQHVRTVVVDPGHGGRDPGAIGVGGLSEKWVTLRLSRALRSELEARGFRVITTRYGDQTVSLRRRIAIAEQQGGDLFLSLHANAAAQRDLHGIVTYYPDKSYARHTLRAAAEGSGTRAPQLDPGGRPFTDFNFSQTSDLSAQLADSVHRRAVSSVRQRYRSLSDLGVRSGPFYVLFLSSMPSVLMEVGFLTHQVEATRMRSNAYVSLLAKAIAEGIAGYRDAGDWDRTHTAMSLSPAAETLRASTDEAMPTQSAVSLERETGLELARPLS